MKYSGFIFDMDGVLLDSEPFWRRAEIEVLAMIGVEVSEDECLKTMGLPVGDVLAIRVPDRDDHDDLAMKISARVKDLVCSHGQPLPGVIDTLNWVKEQGIPCGLATSSSYDLIECVVEVLKVRDTFSVLYSADDELFGKPHPAVYLGAAQRLGVPTTKCLAIEDSVHGMVAAKAARMEVVVIPEPAIRQDPRFGLADAMLTSMEELVRWLDPLVPLKLQSRASSIAVKM